MPNPIETWVFDLDNTLYPSSSDLAAQMSARMASFIVELLGVETEQAKKLQKQYFRDYGTTMRGLMTIHDIDPHRYLDHVHDIDLKSLGAPPALAAALEKLPGRKLVHTNASVKHADRILTGWAWLVISAASSTSPRPTGSRSRTRPVMPS